MLSKKRIAFVALLMCGFVIAVGWTLLPPAKASTQYARGPFYTEWSVPVLVTELKTASPEAPMGISRDCLSLYFQRTTAGTGEDLYVAHRPNLEANWDVPIKLTSNVNTNFNERAVFISGDGHWLYFASDRPGGMGSMDIYTSWRDDVNDDNAWQPAVNLAAVNSPGFESGPTLFDDEVTGTTQLYFNSAPFPGGVQAVADIYVSVLGPGGFEAPTVCAELNSPVQEGRPYLRHDGLEIYFQSNRFGDISIFMSTRSSTTEPWSLPELVISPNDLGVPNINYVGTPVLSWDGTTLFTMAGHIPGDYDIYVTHREMVSAANACLRSPLYYLHNLQYLNSRIGNASVVIGGFNYNQPISIAHHFGVVRAVLQGNSFPGLPPSSPQERLNQEFLAAQISVALAGGPGSAAAYGILNGQLQCYGSMLTFQPITLSNGARLTRYSTMGDLFEQARLALYENRFDDMDALASVFDLLNGNDPSGYCHQ